MTNWYSVTDHQTCIAPDHMHPFKEEYIVLTDAIGWTLCYFDSGYLNCGRWIMLEIAYPNRYTV